MTMLNEKEYPKFKYFLEWYFNASADYSELETLVDEYKTIESKDNIEALQIEVKKLIKLSDKGEIWLFIKKYGMRSMRDEKFKWFLNYLDKNI